MTCQSNRAALRGDGPLRIRGLASAFTLIELLVVITIIMLLVSILLPALGAARRQARATLCLTQVRAISQATLVYATDHRDTLPGGYQWQYTLKHYISLSVHGDQAMSGANQSNMPKVYFCPERRLPFPATTGYPEEFSTYGVNGAQRAGTFGGVNVHFGVHGGRTAIHRLRTPSYTWGIVDTMHYDELYDPGHAILTDALSLPAGDPLRMLAAETKGRRQYRSSMAFPHPNRTANMSYMDGHAAARQGETVAPLPEADYPNAPFWAYRWGSLEGLAAVGFYRDLAIPDATADPDLWGLPYAGD